jgi:hypothetical protein
MRWANVVIAVVTLPLTGCPVHTLVVVQFGIANKTAAALSAPFDINAFCAALTRQGYIVKQQKGRSGDQTEISPDQTEKICREVWLERMQEEQKGKKQ